MAYIFSVLSVIALLVQVLTAQPGPQTTVMGGLLEFIDSGQDRGDPYDSPFDTVYDSEEDDLIDSYKDKTSSEHPDFLSIESSDIDAEPRSRVRRRIIPVGKALDRSGGGGDRTSYGRGRSPWAEAPIKADMVGKRIGPTGSDALYWVYPSLAPAEWRKTHGFAPIPKKRFVLPRKSKHQERDTSNREPVRRSFPIVVNNSKAYTKRKFKLPKDMKDAVAAYAKIHGIQNASTHFTKKYRTPVKFEAVEKYLKKYQKREDKRVRRHG